MTALPSMLPVKLYFSYSHKDKRMKDELVMHLAPLQRQGMIHTRLLYFAISGVNVILLGPIPSSG